MKLNYETTTEDWDNFLEKSPQKNVFLSSKFIESLNTDFKLITCLNDNHEILAGYVALLKKDGTAYDNIFHFTQYQGIILKDFSELNNHKRISKEFEITNFMIEELVNEYNSLAFSQHYNFKDLRPFQWYNYHSPEHGMFDIKIAYTPILDIAQYKNYEEYFKSIRPVRRQEYKKNVSKIMVKESDNTDILVDLHKKTFGRQGIEESTEDLNIIKSIASSAIKDKYGKLLIAYYNAIPISATLFLYYANTIYYMFGANDPQYRNICAGNTIMLDKIRDAFELGIKTIDFVGANSPNRGDYKLSYNGHLEIFYNLKIQKN